MSGLLIVAWALLAIGVVLMVLRPWDDWRKS